MKYLVGVSGGKDSTATLLWVIFQSGYDPTDVIVNFSDTGNEAAVTYEYIRFLSAYIEQRGYAPVHWLHPPLDFFELAKHKRRFPSVKSRFCTEYLKIKPLETFIASIGDDVISISGVRADESKARAELPEHAFDKAGYQVYRPILKWTVDDVWAYLKKRGIPRNPLYDLGFVRVGCFPCVMSRKMEVRLIATHFPKVIDHIRQAEEEIGSTFFRMKHTPPAFRTKEMPDRKNNGHIWLCPGIDDVVRWSFTKRGGKQFDMALGTTCAPYLALARGGA